MLIMQVYICSASLLRSGRNDASTPDDNKKRHRKVSRNHAYEATFDSDSFFAERLGRIASVIHTQMLKLDWVFVPTGKVVKMLLTFCAQMMYASKTGLLVRAIAQPPPIVTLRESLGLLRPALTVSQGEMTKTSGMWAS